MTEFNDVALAFLERPEARAMVAAWPQIRNFRAGRDVGRWAAAAGVHDSTVLELAPVLIGAGICLPDGEIPERARDFIVAATVAAVSRRGRKPKKR